MKTPKTIWFLDVDGVINAISEGKPNTFPEEVWIQTTANAGGETWPIMAATPVLELIREVHEKGVAEIRWHSTWKDEANKDLAKNLNLPEFPVQEAPEHLYNTYRRWWKWDAIRNLVQGENRILWTDDDISKHLETENAHYFNSLFISPQTIIGLTPKHLKQIREFLAL